MINNKENELWDKIYKKFVKLYPNKNIKSITKMVLAEFIKIKNKNPEKYKPTPSSSTLQKSKKKKN